jgi:nitrogen fixation-related uncharacterized protein
MNWSGYILLGFIFASVFFVLASLALFWAHRNGQLSNLEEGSKSIFDEDEPEGEVTDAFPQPSKRKRGQDTDRRA